MAAQWDEAALLWTAHIRTAQAQIDKSVDELIAGFRGILSELDGLIPEGDGLDHQALASRSAAVRAQVQQLMVAFQFQDRVQQILDQVCDSMAAAAGSLQASLHGAPPLEGAAWTALISAGYTTAEQRAGSRLPAHPADAPGLARPAAHATSARAATPASAPAPSIATTYF